MIKRIITKKITAIKNKYRVISITGPRQSGKTTLVKEIFPHHLYTNLEIPETRNFAKEDPHAFLSQNPKIIIDEIQYTPELLSYIQNIVDTDKNKQFIITGSQNLLISQKVSQSLAGRVFIFDLLPLSIDELTSSGLAKTSLIEQIYTGFYPRIYDEKLEAADWYENYIQTYLERDVRQIQNIENLSTFQKFMGLLAGRTGQILNLTSIANDVGTSVPTISSWISILEASFIVKKLMPYYKNFNKRLTKSPKFHFIDSGLICALLNINTTKELEKHPLLGNIFESFIFSEFLKKLTNKQIKGNLYYWREKNNKEIDLILDDGKTPIVIEVKAGQTFSISQIENLLYYKKICKEPVNLKLIYGGSENQKRSDFSIVSWKNV